jgi:hypothetical protein
MEQKTLQPLDNPFGTRLLPMSSDERRKSVPEGALAEENASLTHRIRYRTQRRQSALKEAAPVWS